MKYMGSKNRHAKYITPFVQVLLGYGFNKYVEPFVGGANLIDKVRATYKIGYDSNKYLIALLNYVAQGNPMPETITESEYLKVRDSKESYPDWYVGMVGFCAGYSGKFFGGYARSFDSKGNSRDMPAEALRNLKTQRHQLKGIDFYACDYKNVPKTSAVFYCDPPYFSTTNYKGNVENFDHAQFWQWARNRAQEGNPVLISEYSAPADFTCIWQKKVNSSLSADTGAKQETEKLYLHVSQFFKYPLIWHLMDKNEHTK